MKFRVHIPRRGLSRKLHKQLVAGGVLLLLAMPASVLLSRQVNAVCECNVFSTPTGEGTFSDGAPVELGFKFKPSVDGKITGVRFYKGDFMTGTHVGSLWRTDGTKMAEATFQSETNTGWQNVTFSGPVTVTANTTYIASVTMNDGRYIATSNYFTSDVVNGPLTAPSSASSGGNGVYAAGGIFPNSSFNAANYWVDVSFFDDAESPTVQSVTPADATTGVLPGKTVTATFDQAMDATSFDSSSFIVKDAQDNAIPGTYSYNSSTKTASFIATNGYQPSTQYTVTLKGGLGSAVQNLADTALASDYTWSFTTNVTNECPCSLKDGINPAGAATFSEGTDVELGVKVKASTNGYVTALRFYKPIISTEATHTGHIWDGSGNNLATVDFTNETEYGWQEAKLSSPLLLKEGQVYVLSYRATSGHYVSSTNGLTGTNLSDGYLTAYADQSSENTATGSGTGNGVFHTGGGVYPNSSAAGRYYWIDAVFSTSPATTIQLEVDVTQPKADTYGVQSSQVITAKFNRAVDGTTINSSTFTLVDKDNVPIVGTATYDADKGEATFTPAQPLTGGQRYTAALSGSIADDYGATLGSGYSWSFTTGSAVSTDPDMAPGGPILVVTNASDPYSKYYAEILRTEGLNYFETKVLGDVNATTLNAYKAVVLAETVLTQNQADMFSAWVQNGGNLVAMRPDAKLADLLGIQASGSTRANQYMLVDTSASPGQGLVSETIQFKGTADNYTVDGASAVATFYSDASTSTANPAVTSRSVGAKGGTAAAFTFDLAKSVVALHQGNKAWAGQERDGNSPIRTNDLFFGAATGDAQPDWVDLTKIHIPQADEQQRLLANILTEATKDTQPLPRFWYLPGDNKAAIVLAGDDHSLNNNVGTEAAINDMLNTSESGCSVLDWECIRASHYFYTTSALTNTRAAQFYGYGFDMGDHVSQSCSNFSSYSELASIYADDLAAWRAKYTSLPDQQTHRFHCYTWSDWDSQTKVDVVNGFRYDLNYVAYPRTWIGDRAPLITGSGMNMRLTDANGNLQDVRQGVTNVDNQVANETATSINALIDGALDDGYYGIFGTHYDMNGGTFDKTLIAAAKARGVPTISSQQALTWLDGRNSSTFSNFTGSNGRFSFTVSAGEGAYGLRAMLPIQDAGGTLDTLTLTGSPVSYQTQSVKGVQYAVFNAEPGSYTATYSDYDPNAGSDPDDPDDNPGDDTGSSGSQGNSSTGSQSDGKQNNSSDETPAGNKDTDDSSTPGMPATSSDDESDKDKNGQESSRAAGIPWLVQLIGWLAVIIAIWGGLWWFASRRRRQQS